MPTLRAWANRCDGCTLGPRRGRVALPTDILTLLSTDWSHHSSRCVLLSFGLICARPSWVVQVARGVDCRGTRAGEHQCPPEPFRKGVAKSPDSTGSSKEVWRCDLWLISPIAEELPLTSSLRPHTWRILRSCVASLQASPFGSGNRSCSDASVRPESTKAGFVVAPSADGDFKQMLAVDCGGAVVKIPWAYGHAAPLLGSLTHALLGTKGHASAGCRPRCTRSTIISSPPLVVGWPLFFLASLPFVIPENGRFPCSSENRRACATNARCRPAMSCFRKASPLSSFSRKGPEQSIGWRDTP